MIILLVLRRMSPRGRRITGTTLLALGAAVFAVSVALSINQYIHGAILLALGGVCFLPLKAAGRRSGQIATVGRPGAQ